MKSKFIFLALIFIGLISCNKKIENKSNFEIKQDSIYITDSLNFGNLKENTKVIPSELQPFITKNYLILDTLSSDLNQDGLNDYLLILKNKDEETLSDVSEHPEKRPLLILIRNKANQLELKSQNDNVVFCVDCGGMMGDPYVTMVYKDGYFSIEHYGGSSWRWVHIITFKYDKKKNDWYLHKDVSEGFHTDDLQNIKTNKRTVKDFGIVRFNEFDIYN